MKISNAVLALVALFSVSGVNAATITTFTDRSAFNSAVGTTTLENFTNAAHYPIPNGALSSTTSFTSIYTAPLNAGDIKAGATYTTPVTTDTAFYFNIDAGGLFTNGGALDSLSKTSKLTISYDPLVAAFGFDAYQYMSEFDVMINFLGGSSYTKHFSFSTSVQFFGFQSDAADIQSVVIGGTNTIMGFAIDDHSYGGTPSPVPLPSATWLLFSGLLSLIGVARRSKQAYRAAN